MSCYWRWLATILTVLLVGYSSSAYAESHGDRVVPYISIREVYDSNVFRVKDKQQLTEFAGDSRLYDSLTILTVGMGFNYPVRRQEIGIRLRKDFLRYDHYNRQDFEQDDVRGNISFKFSDRIRAKIDGGYTKSLESRENYLSLNKNVRTVLAGGISVGYVIPSGFSINASVMQENVDFSISELGSRENKTKGYSGNLSYSPSHDTKLDFLYERSIIDFNLLQSISDQLVNNDSRRNTIKLDLYRRLSSGTLLSISAGQLWKEHKEFDRRDFHGGIGRAEVTYGMTGKLILSLIAERRLHEEIFFDQIYSINNSTGLRLVYKPTVKIELSVYGGASTKSFKGNSDIVTDSLPSREDRLKELSTVMMWSPVKQFSVELGYSFATRNSNFDIYNYTDNVIDAGIRYRY